MSIQKHFLNSNGVFLKHKDSISSAIDKSFMSIKAVLPVDDIDIVVLNSPDNTISEIGIGGFAPDGHTIFLSLDLSHSKIVDAINIEILKILSHEVHHCMRWRGPGYGVTLFEALVTEGLADHFQVEITGGSPPNWTNAVQGEELKNIFNIAMLEYWKSYNHNDWFFGSQDRKIPKFTGYSLGFSIVRDYLTETKKIPSELYSITAKEVFEVVERIKNNT